MPERGETDLEMAVRHVAEARRIVEQQHRRIAKLREAGEPTFKHEQMLRAFERTLQIFEDDERRIRSRGNDGPTSAGVHRGMGRARSGRFFRARTIRPYSGPALADELSVNELR
jgi:hypothetical protein